MVSSKLVRMANQASAEEIASVAEIPNEPITLNEKSFLFRVVSAPSLSANDKANLWKLWEANMRAMVEPSSFGWHPSKKKKEMFHRNARYILVFSGALHEENGQSALPIAYSMFRFDREAGEDIIYCYELQVSTPFRSSGLGKVFVEKLTKIGKHWHMSKIVLTVLKSNLAARSFYARTGFELDPGSPECESANSDDVGDDGSEPDSYDYEILSKVLS